MTEISPEKHKKTVLFLPQKVRKRRIFLKSKMHVFLMLGQQCGDYLRQ